MRGGSREPWLVEDTYMNRFEELGFLFFFLCVNVLVFFNYLELLFLDLWQILVFG